ncbi:universal stress protein, partial [Klebsiella pneumoniae]|nr:universal stress protein [Klebsiella pneumoniae]
TYHPGIELTGTFSANTQQLLADQLVEIEGQCNHLLLAQGKALLKSRSELLK